MQDKTNQIHLWTSKGLLFIQSMSRNQIGPPVYKRYALGVSFVAKSRIRDAPTWMLLWSLAYVWQEEIKRHRPAPPSCARRPFSPC